MRYLPPCLLGHAVACAPEPCVHGLECCEARAVLRAADEADPHRARPGPRAEPSSARLLEGTVLRPRGEPGRRLVVERRLGRGGMAEVYLVREPSTGARCALKLPMRPSPGRDLQLRLEGRLQGGMRHANIVGVVGVVQLEFGPALLLDWVSGPSLAAVLEGELLEVDEAVGIFRALLHAMAYAHANGVIHRDLKPHNVLLDIQPSGLVPRITDFGIAEVRGGDLPTPAGIVGTPAYLAPELLGGGASATVASDLFALGVVLYEMLAGAVPFDGTDTGEVVAAQRSSPAPLSVVRPEAPLALRALVDALLAQRPEDRPKTCKEVLERLDGRPWTPSALAHGAPALDGPLMDHVLRRWSAETERFLWPHVGAVEGITPAPADPRTTYPSPD